MDENTALKALRRREETALAWFIERYTPYVTTIIFRILGGAALPDVEEIASDVFLVLWQNAKSIRAGKVKGYLSSTARNKAKERLRRTARELPLVEDVLAAADTDLEYDFERREQGRLVRRAMLKMECPDREIFLRHYYYFQPVSQIAEEMDMNLSTVKTRLRRGREKLKEELRKGGWMDEDF